MVVRTRALKGRYGLTEDLYSQIALGEISGTSIRRQTGYQGAVGSTEIPVWGLPQEYPFPEEAQSISVSSTSALDSFGSTGAEQVKIEGLDSSFVFLSEIVNLEGLTPVYAENKFRRIYRNSIIKAGETKKNQGNIYIGYGDVLEGICEWPMDYIEQGENSSQLGIFTVPKGQVFLITNIWLANIIEQDPPSKEYGVIYRSKASLVDEGLFRTRVKLKMPTSIQNFLFEVGRAILPEKTDFLITAQSPTETATVSISINGMLVRQEASSSFPLVPVI